VPATLLPPLCLLLGVALTSGQAHASPVPVEANRLETVPATVFGDSTSVPCAPGTTDLGVHDGYHSSIRIRVRLCAVNYISNGRVGASGHAIVNSRVSAAVQAIVRDMKAAGLSVVAASSYRSMDHQRDLCAGDARCRAGDHRFLASPGTSNHQMGLAVDFFRPYSTRTAAGCAAPASAPGNPIWRWLHAHAAHYGLKQYSAEPWHWEAAGANRC
jgi:hypothetical protein